jgi:hypothetical protein
MHHDVVAAEAAEVGVEKGVAGEPVDAAIPSVGGYLEAGGGRRRVTRCDEQRQGEAGEMPLVCSAVNKKIEPGG